MVAPARQAWAGAYAALFLASDEAKYITGRGTGRRRRRAARVSADRKLFFDPVESNSVRASGGLVAGDSSSRIVNEIRRRFGSTSNTL